MPAAGGNTFAATLSQLPAGRYDVKMVTFDAEGHEVILDWLRADTAAAETITTGKSLTVRARETDGAITLDANDLLTVDPGLYRGGQWGQVNLSAILSCFFTPFSETLRGQSSKSQF